MATDDKKPDELASLAAQAQASMTVPPLGEGTTELDTTAGQGPTDAQAMAMIEEGAKKVLLALAKLARAAIAKRLPEIREEWTDEDLAGPAAAAVPLLKKHMDKLMTLAGSSPEAAAFALSLIPLVLGVVNAMDRAEQRRKAEASTAAPGAAAPDAGAQQ